MSEKAPQQEKQESKSSKKKEGLPKELRKQLQALEFTEEEIQAMKKEEAEDIVRIQSTPKTEVAENVKKVKQGEQKREEMEVPKAQNQEQRESTEREKAWESLVPISVKRTSGQIEDGWKLYIFDGTGVINKALALKKIPDSPGEFLEKWISTEELKTLNPELFAITTEEELGDAYDSFFIKEKTPSKFKLHRDKTLEEIRDAIKEKQESKSSKKKEKLPKGLVNDLLALNYSTEEIQKMSTEEAKSILENRGTLDTFDAFEDVTDKEAETAKRKIVKKNKKETTGEMNPEQALTTARREYQRQAEVAKASQSWSDQSWSRRIRFWKKLDQTEEAEAGPQYTEAKKAYFKARKNLIHWKVGEKEKELRAEGKTDAEIVDAISQYKKGELFDEAFIKETKKGIGPETMKYKPEVRSLLSGGLEWYEKQNRVTKIAISSTFITLAGAATAGTFAVGAGSIYLGKRIGRALLGAAAGQYVMKKVREAWEDPAKTIEQKLATTKELARDTPEAIEAIDKDLDVLLERNKVLSSSTKRSIGIGLIGVASGAGTSMGLSALDTFFDDPLARMTGVAEKEISASKTIEAEEERRHAKLVEEAERGGPEAKVSTTASAPAEKVSPKPAQAEPEASSKFQFEGKSRAIASAHEAMRDAKTTTIDSLEPKTPDMLEGVDEKKILETKFSPIKESTAPNESGIPKEAIIGTNENNWGITQVLKQQLEANDELAKELGYNQNAGETAKANYLLKLGKQLGYIDENGNEVRIADATKPAAYVLSAEGGKPVVTEFLEDTKIETHSAGTAFEGGNTEDHEEVWKKPAREAVLKTKEPGIASVTEPVTEPVTETKAPIPWTENDPTVNEVVIKTYGATSMDQILDTSSNALEGYPEVREAIINGTDAFPSRDGETLAQYLTRYESSGSEPVFTESYQNTPTERTLPPQEAGSRLSADKFLSQDYPPAPDQERYLPERRVVELERDYELAQNDIRTDSPFWNATRRLDARGFLDSSDTNAEGEKLKSFMTLLSRQTGLDPDVIRGADGELRRETVGEFVDRAIEQKTNEAISDATEYRMRKELRDLFTPRSIFSGAGMKSSDWATIRDVDATHFLADTTALDVNDMPSETKSTFENTRMDRLERTVDQGSLNQGAVTFLQTLAEKFPPRAGESIADYLGRRAVFIDHLRGTLVDAGIPEKSVQDISTGRFFEGAIRETIRTTYDPERANL